MLPRSRLKVDITAQEGRESKVATALPPRREIDILVDLDLSGLRIRGGASSDYVINLRLCGFRAWHEARWLARCFGPRIQNTQTVSHQPLCKIMVIRRMKLTACCNAWSYASRMWLQLTIKIACNAQRMSAWNGAERLIQLQQNLAALLQSFLIRARIPGPLINVEDIKVGLSAAFRCWNTHL